MNPNHDAIGRFASSSGGHELMSSSAEKRSFRFSNSKKAFQFASEMKKQGHKVTFSDVGIGLLAGTDIHVHPSNIDAANAANAPSAIANKSGNPASQGGMMKAAGNAGTTVKPEVAAAASVVTGRQVGVQGGASKTPRINPIKARAIARAQAARTLNFNKNTTPPLRFPGRSSGRG